MTDASTSRASLDPDARAEQAARLLLDPEPGWALNYGAMVVLSAVIAALGMRLDSAPIVIGAMLVAPVMRPVLGLGFACLTNVARSSVIRLGAVLLATTVALVAVGAAITIVVPSTEVALAGEVLARTAPDVRDLGVALAAGAVGAFAILRPRVADTIPGVAIAVALVPPPVAAGIAMGESFRTQAVGALLLYVTNLAAIVFGTVVTVLALRLAGERPFELHRPRLGWAAGIVLAALVAVGVPLSGAFADAVDSAQAERDRSLRAEARQQMQDSARGEIEAWVAASDQPNLGVVSITIPETDPDDPDDAERSAISVVLLGDVDGYIPPLGDLEGQVAEAIDQDVLLSLRLVAVADQVSSRFEVEPNPEADADAQLRNMFRASVLEWTQGFSGVRVVNVSTPEPGIVSAIVASVGELPATADLDEILMERTGSVPRYELVVTDLVVPGAVALSTPRSPGPASATVVVDDRIVSDTTACVDDEGRTIIRSGDLVIEVGNWVTISDGTAEARATDVSRSGPGGSVDVATFDRDRTGISRIDIEVTGTPPDC